MVTPQLSPLTPVYRKDNLSQPIICKLSIIKMRLAKFPFSSRESRDPPLITQLLRYSLICNGKLINLQEISIALYVYVYVDHAVRFRYYCVNT